MTLMLLYPFSYFPLPSKKKNEKSSIFKIRPLMMAQMLPLEDSFAPILGMTGDQLRALMATGVTNLYGINLTNSILSDNPYDLISRTDKPLSKKVFCIPGTTDLFTQWIQKFVSRVIVNHPNVTQTRRDAYVQLTRSLVARDRMFAISIPLIPPLSPLRFPIFELL